MTEPTENPVPLASPQTRLERALAAVPRFLASKGHIIWLGALGIYLIVLPLIGVHVPQKYELIGGNYTNVTSDVGACIAAGGTLHLVRRAKARQAKDDDAHRLVAETHALLTRFHGPGGGHEKQADDIAALAQAIRAISADPAATAQAERLARPPATPLPKRSKRTS